MSARRWKALGAAALVAALGVGCNPPSAPPPPGPIDPEAPAGWRRWEHAPAECRLYVPERLEAVAPLELEACPFQPGGCVRAVARDAEHAGFGIGGPLSVVAVDGHTDVAFTRAVPPAGSGWFEVGLFRDGKPVGAWREQIPGGGCVLGTPSLSSDGTASMALIRGSAENAPWVYLGPTDRLMQAPERLERFGPPNAAVLPRDVVRRAGDQLVLWEHYGRFAVRDLKTGVTVRPEPEGQAYRFLQNPTPVGSTVLYWVWTGRLGSLWMRGSDGSSTPFLRDEAHSYDALASDGRDVVWTRGTEPLGINRFLSLELWTAAASEDGRVLVPRKVATLPAHDLPLLSVGEGWVAARLGPGDVRLYRLADGAERQVPTVPGLAWDAPQVAGGAVWLKALPEEGPSRGALALIRFSLDALETSSDRDSP